MRAAWQKSIRFGWRRLPAGYARSTTSIRIGRRHPAQVSAFERVTLYGLTVMPKRRVYYGTHQSKEAREIFIRSALVAGEYVTQAPFYRHNRKLIADVAALEHKTRRPDVLVDEERDFRVLRRPHPGGDMQRRSIRKMAQAGRAGKPRACSILPGNT